ncbi:MAG: rRNA methyltransferase [Candidatus Omnitrophica bacterium]|nr:rRNA methyltransferase [Candidatus Omnitrophota bacterium]
MDFLITCKSNYEKILARESDGYQLKPSQQGQGWVLLKGDDKAAFTDLCFACHVLLSPLNVSAASVNALTEKLVNLFGQHVGSTRILGPWPFLFFSSTEGPLIQHAKTVEKYCFQKLQKKMSRVTKLAREGIPAGAKFAEGFFVYFTGFNQALVSFQALSQGQQRMTMDPQAPSRSYLKIEESFQVFGRAPRENEKVIDLGASPGGWSHSALKRGASVIAVDNGPLREPVKSHPRVHHLKADALKYRHEEALPVDWLLCDVLEKPEMILELLEKWFSHRWCRFFIVNLKVGRLDSVALLKSIRDKNKGLAPYCKELCIRQLYHDREEITLMGEVKPPSSS